MPSASGNCLGCSTQLHTAIVGLAFCPNVDCKRYGIDTIAQENIMRMDKQPDIPVCKLCYKPLHETSAKHFFFCDNGKCSKYRHIVKMQVKLTFAYCEEELCIQDE